MEDNQTLENYSSDDMEVMLQAELAKDKEANRIDEIINYCKNAGIKKVGVAHCVSVNKEAERFSNILTDAGFQVASVNCKFGKIPMSDVLEDKKGLACNPIGQAESLGEQKTELNVMMGLCLGHDMLFNQHSKAPVTALVVKDRKLKHQTIQVLNNN
jgi:uncharacterized metal-binding protein